MVKTAMNWWQTGVSSACTAHESVRLQINLLMFQDVIALEGVKTK
jgi:hypothetical protein